VGAAVVLVAKDSGNMVGQYALMPTQLSLGGEIVLGAQSVDTMTHPEYRNQGMFAELAGSCMELAASRGIRVLYGFPNQNSYPGFVQKLNWDHTGDIHVWMRVLNSDAFVSQPMPVRQIVSFGSRFLPMGNVHPRGVEIREQMPEVDELLRLENSMVPENLKAICRISPSKDWIIWRTDSASQSRYFWFSGYREDTLVAYAVFGINAWEKISLVNVLGSDTQALEAVVSRAARHAKQLGLPAVRVVTNYEKAEQVLKSCGFFQRRSLPLIVRSLTSKTLQGNIHVHSSWRINSADVDAF
jgi:GNAT superfamily N-acetyltransferase